MRCKALLVVLSFAFSAISIRTAKSTASAGQVNTVRPSGARAILPGKTPPDHAAYDLFFRQLARLHHKAALLDQQGKDGMTLRSMLAQRVGLDPPQAQILEEVAFSSLEQAMALDQRAREIIRQAHAKHPEGKLNPGEPIPLAPPELRSMQIERDNIFLRARDRLRAELGDWNFETFDRLLKESLVQKAVTIAP